MAIKPLTIKSHTYEPTGDKNILKFVDREGNWTHYWIRDKRIFVPAVNHIIRLGYPKGERFYHYLLNATPEVAERKLRTAGEEGTRSHTAIRDLIRGDRVSLDSRYFNELTERFEPLSHEEWRNLEAFINWAERYKPRLIIHEHSLWSEEYKYAGTLDFVGTIHIPTDDKTAAKEIVDKDILVLIDWKTSGGIWDDYELQIAAYRQAALEKLSSRLYLPHYQDMWTAIVRLGTNHKAGYEMKLWNPHESDANFRLFKSVLEIFKKKTGDGEFEPDVRDIPAEFAIRIPRVRPQKAKMNENGKYIKTKKN